MADRDVSVKVGLKGVKQFKSGMSEVSGSLTGALTNTDLISSALKKAASAILTGLKESVDSAVEFESALAAVQRRSGMSDTALERFGQNIQNLSTKIPVAATELLSIAENAAQLGIANGDLLAFTETMAGLGFTTNMSAEDASTGFARMSKLMGTASEDYSRLGSVMIELGSNFATTESEILDMSVSLASTGALYEITEADIMGVSTALTSLGIQSAMGSSNFTKIVGKMSAACAAGGEDLAGFASAAGMTTDEFKSYAEVNGTMAAFTSVINGLASGATDTASALDKMGIKSVREVKIMNTLIAGADTLTDALYSANNAWAENSAFAEAVGIQYDTTEAKIIQMQNSVENLKTSVGTLALGTVGQMATNTAEMMEGLRQGIAGYGDLGGQLRDIVANYDAQRTSLTATAESAELYIQAIENMGDPLKLTDDQLAIYRNHVAALTTLYPTLAHSVDASTGEIKGGAAGLRAEVASVTEASRAMIDAMETGEKLESWQVLRQRITEEQSLYDILTLKVQGYQTEADNAKAVLDEMVDSGLIDGNWNVMGNMTDADLDRWEAAKRIVEDFNAMDMDVNSDYRQAYDELDQLAVQLDEDIKLSEMFERSVGATYEAATAVAASVDGVYDTFETRAVASMQNVYSATAAYLNSIESAYDDAYKYVKKNLIEDMTSGLAPNDPKFDATYKDAARQTLEKYMNNPLGQLEYAKQYAETVAKLREMGMDENALAQLNLGGSGYKDVMDMLIEGGPEAIKQFEDAYAAYAEAEDMLTRTLASSDPEVIAAKEQLDTVTTAADAAITAMVENSDKGTEAYASAVSTMQGLIRGVGDYLSMYQGKVNSVTKLSDKLADAGSAANGINGSHALGLERVPFDGYIAKLHKDEQVLTAAQAKAYRAMSNASLRATVHSQNTVSVQAPQPVMIDYEQLADAVSSRPVSMCVDSRGFTEAVAVDADRANAKRSARLRSRYGRG